MARQVTNVDGKVKKNASPGAAGLKPPVHPGLSSGKETHNVKIAKNG